ncbi:MAG: PfkB family carbohydrate kinase [Verrucomicrobia bacterium]|nr:PfkB family carbohydrate kinase [Verrucomicrobiota bacterium]
MRPTLLGRDENCPEIVGVGAATLDDLWLVDDFLSDEDGVQQALSTSQMGGGPVATSLCVLSRLSHNVALFDSCGEDAAGEEIIAGLKKSGVNTKAIKRVPGAMSARAVIMVRARDGARQITYMPSTATEPMLDDSQAQMIRTASLLHLNGRHETLARACSKIAQSAGILISYDGGSGRYRESIRDLLQASHIRLVSKSFAKQFTGCADVDSMMKCLLCGPAKVVVITDGLNGSYVQSLGGEFYHQRAYHASKTIDTTGCGDVFHGAFLHGYLSGLDCQACADFASQLASKNAIGLGGRHVLELDLDLIAP